jgi:hypothetical protein
VIFVDIAFAPAEVDPAEQLAAWRDLVNRAFRPLAITPLPGAGRPSEFSGSVAGGDWGGLRSRRGTKFRRRRRIWGLARAYAMRPRQAADYLKTVGEDVPGR